MLVTKRNVTNILVDLINSDFSIVITILAKFDNERDQPSKYYQESKLHF